MVGVVNRLIAKEPYVDVGHFKIPLRKNTDSSTTDYLDLELAPRGNYSTEAVVLTRVVSGNAILTRSALVLRPLRSGPMGAVARLAKAARPSSETSTTARGLLAVQNIASVNDTRHTMSGVTLGSTSALTATKFWGGLARLRYCQLLLLPLRQRCRQLPWRRRGVNVWHQRLR